jgi:RNA polymerase sigma factor (sigma-70 family)
MDLDPPPPHSPQTELERYVAAQLGPHSLSRFQDPEIQKQAQHLLESGVALEDVALRLAHQEGLRDPHIGNEFIGHFLTAMMKIGHFSLGDGLRRFLDSGDLVNSVAGSVWQDLAHVECKTRKEFLAFLGKRMQWKAADKVKGLNAKMRRNDLQRELDLEVAALGPNEQQGPSTMAGNKEEMDRVIVAMVRLPDRDQDLLRRHLRGESNSQIASALSMKPETSRKALQRAIKKLQTLV